MSRTHFTLTVMLVALLSTSPSAAQSQPAPVATPGEVLLQISARGSASSPPDTITMTVPVTASAATATAARSANRAKLDNLTRALTAAGIAPGSIALLNSNSARMGFIGNEAYGDFGEGGNLPPALAAAAGRKTAQSLLQIKLTDPSQIQRVTEVLDAADEALLGGPVLALNDDGTARRAAVAGAIARARSDAENYASALGLRVARITRVSNQGAATPSPDDFVQMLTAAQGKDDKKVVTDARVWVDFVLVPR